MFWTAKEPLKVTFTRLREWIPPAWRPLSVVSISSNFANYEYTPVVCMYFPGAICIGKLLAFVASNWQIVATTCYFWSLTNWKASEQHIAWNSSRHSPEFCLNYEKFQHTYYPYRKFHNTLWRTCCDTLPEGFQGCGRKDRRLLQGLKI